MLTVKKRNDGDFDILRNGKLLFDHPIPKRALRLYVELNDPRINRFKFWQVR